jgi:hypothetical protein
MLDDKKITATVAGETLEVSIVKGCPQGVVLSHILWSLVVGKLTEGLNVNSCYTMGYTDDTAIPNSKKLLHHNSSSVKCFEFYNDGNVSADDDGSAKYCGWCGQGGMLYCCSFCTRAFCKPCLIRNLGYSGLADIEAADYQSQMPLTYSRQGNDVKSTAE